MPNNFNRALSAGLLFTALMGLSQPASFAGFGNLFGGGGSDSSSSSGSSSKTNVNSSNPTANGDENTFVPPGAQGQIVDPDPQTPLIKDKKKVKDTTGAPPANGDFTADEKLMQNRFRQRIANAHKNIDKGEKMMLSCGSDHNKAEYKKGKVMKEIGEKDLAALKENSPFPSNSSLDPDRPARAKKPDSL
ncbi:MAG: hypothetical protein P4L53_03025 [Candidatus Obscuribacterales bacterium]|nr:hypothetical protein [Candidatus Obscuribacterales bacterium]